MDDGVADLEPIRNRLAATDGLFEIGSQEPEAFARIRRSESIGRPLGDAAFLGRLAAMIGRDLKPGRRGPSPRVMD